MAYPASKTVSFTDEHCSQRRASPPQTASRGVRSIHSVHPYVLKSRVAFGGGLILIGNDREKKNLMSRPDAAEKIKRTMHLTSRSPATNHVGVRHLKNEEVRILEGNLYSPTMQQCAEDIKEVLRPSDTLDHSKWRDNGQHIPQRRGSESEVQKERYTAQDLFYDVAATELERKWQQAAFPNMTSHRMFNQYCENLMADGPKARTIMNINRKNDAKKRWLKFLAPSINTLPIYAVRVRWKMGPKFPGYTLELVHALLSRHGRIVSLSPVTPNSAVVVFSDVETARRTFKCSTGVSSSTPLICSWWFPEMNNYNKMIHEQRTREEKKMVLHLNESTIIKLEFKKIQEKCMIHLKKYQWGLSYDRATFVP